MLSEYWYPTKLKLTFFAIFLIAIFMASLFGFTKLTQVCNGPNCPLLHVCDDDKGCPTVEQQSLQYSLMILPITLGLSYFLAALLHAYLKGLQS